ncbi:MAG TPA: chromosome segregation protein SMC [Dehalococcoidia bacterium]|nr:chromosome segregation protein SMC [Dehalococcoidia bacterium]
MYLKRLELRGFKSFAAPTVFHFGTGITGVVGPNGVGKSNVADAIRWVLGEQSARTLRARRLEDVIFSGSSQKSPVGMAEVNLVLDNSDGWLPIDFQEVVVGRRAYRDGQGEYLINRSRVRLRDVNDLFLHSELGEGGYAFIGQGLVEEVLSLRPNERRALIEEAADVRRYRVKLDEALSRLAATRDNLDRVDLLLSEISPNLARLERQAERADMHARLSRELAQALQAWYGHQWREAQDFLTAALAGCDQRQEEFRQAEAQIVACNDGAEALRRAIEERRRDIARRTAAERDLSDQVRRLEHQCALDEERQRMLGERLQELRSDIETLTAERERRQEEESGVHERKAALDQEVEKRRAEAVTCRRELEQAENERADLRRRAVEAEEQAIRARNVIAEIEARLARVLKTEEGLREEIEELRSRRKDNLRRLAALGRDYKGHHDEKARLEKELADVAENQSAVNDTIAETRRALARAEERVPEIQADVQRAKARADILGRVHVEHEGFDEATRMLLTAAGQAPRVDEEDPEPGSLQGYIGVLAGLIRVPPGLEKAIEAALVDSLQSIVLATHSDVLAAVQLLMEHPRGRVTLYSADNLTPSHPLVLMQEKGTIGVASEVVACDARFRLLIDTLLGRTIVVENLIIAQRVLKRGMGNVVTLDGELLRPTGSVTSGSSRTMGALIARESELRGLPEEMSDLEAALKRLHTEIDGYRRTLRDSDAALGAHAEKQQRLWQERAALEQSLVEHRAHLAQLSGQMRELRHQEARTSQTVKQVLAERESLERERDSLTGETAAAIEAAERQSEVISAVTERLPELTDALTRASSALAAVEGERQALDMRRDEHETALTRVDAQTTRKRAQLADLEKQMSTSSERLRQANEALTEKQRLWGDLAGVQKPGEEELGQLESREKGLRREMEVALSRRRDAEIGLLEAQNEVKLKTDEIEALREGMEGEGLTPNETGDVVPVSSGMSRSLPDWLSGEPASVEEPEDRLPPIRGGTSIDPVALKEQISHLRARIRSLGPVDAQAPADYTESRQRYDFLSGQVADLGQAETMLQEAIGELEEKIKERFAGAFQKVDEEFQRYFATFFGGGTARLVQTQAKEEGDEPGIEVMAQPPGKRVASLSMLSGGERALTAVSLLFALLQTRPSPFCVLDEVDAMLDESNVGRFAEAVKKLADATQFIIITHNRRTIEMADHIYGVAMAKNMTSSILSLRLSELAPT